MTTVRVLLDQFSEGELDLDQLAEAFRSRRWPPRQHATDAQAWGVHDDDPPSDDSWELVESDSRLSPTQYEVLAAAYEESHRTRKQAITEDASTYALSLIDGELVTGHLPGQHDQSTHGLHGMTGLFRRARSGGFTYSVAAHSHAKTGFALSPYPDRSKVVESRDFTPHVIERYRDDNRDLLQRPNHFLGAWREQDSAKGVDRVWLDVSIVIRNRAEAARVGHQFDQVAMYDLGKGQEIPLGGTGGKAALGDAPWRRVRSGDP